MLSELLGALRRMQTIVDGFQHEQPDYWLTFGNPWEIERLNVGYPIKFYGHVSVHEEEGRQVFRWNPGESVRAPALNPPLALFPVLNPLLGACLANNTSEPAAHMCLAA